MKKSERFDSLCERMLSDLPRSLADFVDLCREVGLSQTTADNLFYARFGLSAESFLLLFDA